MGALSIGEILAKAQPAKVRRTFEPCRRNSYDVNDRRSRTAWRPIAGTNREARRLIGARMYAAEQFNRAHKRPGDREGLLSLVGLEVLRELYRIVNFKSGRLEPSIDYICRKVRRARATVVRALDRLRKHGFLDWIRRTEPTRNEGAGPQVRQVTNAYWFSVPAGARHWVDKVCGPAPAPDCAIAHQEDQETELELMLAATSPDGYVDFVAGPELAEILKRMIPNLLP